MTISKISFSQNMTKSPNKKFNYVKATGYGALASGCFCALAYKKRKIHKYFAALAGILSLLHIGILESYRIKK